MRFSSNPVTMASGGTLTSAFDMGFGGGYINLSIGSVSATTVYVQSAEKIDGTYRRVYMPGQGSTSGTQFQHSMALSQAVVSVPPGQRFVKIETQAAVTNGTEFKVLYCY